MIKLKKIKKYKKIKQEIVKKKKTKSLLVKKKTRNSVFFYLFRFFSNYIFFVQF